MQKFFVKVLAGIMFFYSKKKRKAFRSRYSTTFMQTRRLIRKGVLGRSSYIHHTSSIRDSRTRIGKFCSIAPHVSIGTTSHPLQYLSSSPVFYMDVFSSPRYGLVMPDDRKVKYSYSKPVVVGNDVWIGLNAVIMDGVTIGDGAVIGAGAIVTKDVPPYAVALGIPARVTRYRFDEKTVERLLRTRWWDQPDEVIASLPADDVGKCLDILENLPASTASGAR